MNRIKQTVQNPIFYKISIDVLILSLITALAFLILETLIPGVISSYISALQLFFFIFALSTLISFLSHKQGVTTNNKIYKKPILIFSVLFFTFFISIASFRYGYFFGIITVTISISIFLLLHSLFKDILKNT